MELVIHHAIPKKIRDMLNLKPNDRIFYLVEGDRVILKPLKGDILELRGSVPAHGGPADFQAIRTAVRQKMAKRILSED